MIYQNRWYYDYMKILYVHAKGEVGGSDISLLTILKSINKNLFLPNVIVPKKGPFFKDYKKYCGKCEEVKFTVLKSPDNVMEFLKNLVWFIPSILLIWRVIKKWNIDLVHVNTIVIPSAVIAAKLAGKPIIVHKRELIVSNKIASWGLDIITFLFADKVIAISNAVKYNSIKFLQKKTVVIYNGVDPSEFSSKRSNKLRKLYRIPQKTLLIGIFSRIEPWKGQDIVIRILPKILTKIGNVKLFIFGQYYTSKGKRYFEEIKKLVDELKLDKFILFPGTVKNINKVYGEFDIVILPSIDPEPLGRVAIEAMAAGSAIIATDNGGTKEIIDNGKNGLLVKAGNLNDMENAIIKLARTPDLRDKMSIKGRETVQKHFNIRTIVRGVESVYENLIERNSV